MNDQDTKRLRLLELENQNSLALSQSQSAPAESTAVDSATPQAPNSVPKTLSKGRSEQLSKVEKYFGPRLTAAADKYGLDRNALTTVLLAEAAPHPVTGADSTANTRILDENGLPKSTANGLFQFIDGTAKDMGITDKSNASQSIEGGAKYLRQNLDRFGTYDKAMVAHHEGGDGLQRAIDAADSDTTGQSHWSDYIKPEARKELSTFANLYSGLGGSDSELTAYQSPSQVPNQATYDLGQTESNGRYPINENDPRLAKVPDDKLKKAIATNRRANALLAPGGQDIPEQVYKDAQNSGDVHENLLAGLGRTGFALKSLVKTPSQQEQEDAVNFDRRAGAQQKIGAAIPEIVANTLGGEYAVAKFGLKQLGGEIGAKIVSRVPGSIPEKVGRFVGERVGVGAGYSAPQVGMNNARALANGESISPADNTLAMLAGPAMELGVGTIGELLTKIAPGVLTKAMGQTKSDLLRPGAMDPKLALEQGLVKGSMAKTAKSLDNELNSPNGLNRQVQDRLYYDSRRIAPNAPEQPLALPEGRGDYYKDVPPPQLTPPRNAPEVAYTGYNTKPRPPAPSRPPDVIPIKATPAQKAADDARILAQNNAEREANIALAKKAALDRKAAEKDYSEKVLKDKADALLSNTKPQSDVTSARQIPEVGTNPNSIPSTKTLAEKRTAAAKAESDRLTTNRQAEDDKLVNDALNKDDFLENGKPNLKGQRGSADVGALKELATKAVEGSRSLKDPFPTVRDATSYVKGKLKDLASKKEVTPYIPISHGPVPEGSSLVHDYSIDPVKAIDDAEKSLRDIYHSERGSDLRRSGYEEAKKALDDSRMDVTNRSSFDKKSGKVTPITAKGFLDRVDDRLKEIYDYRSKNNIAHATPAERTLLEVQKNLRQQFSDQLPETSALITKQAERIPILLNAKKQVDKKFLQQASAYSLRGTIGGVAGSAIGYATGGTPGAIAGGILGGLGSKHIGSAEGARNMYATGKILKDKGLLKSLAVNSLIKEEDERRKTKARTGAK